MKTKRLFLLGILLLVAFVVWTLLIQVVDVQPIGQNGTNVGFATFNMWFHQLTGVHMAIYTITDWLGLVPIFICMIFGGIGFGQLIKRRSLLKVSTVSVSQANVSILPINRVNFWLLFYI